MSKVMRFVESEMENHPIALLIDDADKTIDREDFDTVVDLHTDDVVLVSRRGTHAVARRKSEARWKPLLLALTAPRSQTGWNGDSKQGDAALRFGKDVGVAKNIPVEELNATYVLRKDALVPDRQAAAYSNCAR